MIAKERPALIITDILMPRMDGFALMQSLRTDPKTSRIPVVFLSATYITPEDKAFAMELGAVRFLEKPVDTPEFLLAVAEILTQGPPTIPPPMEENEFYRGYRERLESKLRHKSQQITRTERLLETLPDDQKPAFESILKEARSHQLEIQEELDELFKILAQGDDPK
jgi:DNA-binding response OmpR family regulator